MENSTLMKNQSSSLLGRHQHLPHSGQVLRVALALTLSLLLGACAATTRTLDPNTEKHYDATYGFSDKKQIVRTLTESLLSSSNVITEKDRPVLIVYGVDNETSEHINTGGITDDIRLALIKSKEYRFILSGTLRSIAKEESRQWRLNKRELIYYSMNLELTNLETGEISWADNVEIARESSRPIIGW